MAALVDKRVDFVVIGAVALVLHGSARVTRDLDLCYSREPPNLRALSAALKPLAPTLRGAPDTLPFTLDAATLASGLNFTLTCSAGDLDLLGFDHGNDLFVLLHLVRLRRVVLDPFHCYRILARVVANLRNKIDLEAVCQIAPDFGAQA